MKKQKGIVLVSGGIDSPVAAALALGQGIKVELLHFCNMPFSDEETEKKVERIVKHLAKRFGKKIRLITAQHGRDLTEIGRNCERKLNCVLCRRMMFRVAGRIAKKRKADFLVTGESLGQVASQTLSNIASEVSSTGMNIARPLLGMDKLEIEKLAKKFGTYDISIGPGGCCTTVPEKPATKATRERAENEEKKLDVDGLAGEAVKGMKIREIG